MERHTFGLPLNREEMLALELADAMIRIAPDLPAALIGFGGTDRGPAMSAEECVQRIEDIWESRPSLAHSESRFLEDLWDWASGGNLPSREQERWLREIAEREEVAPSGPEGS